MADENKSESAPRPGRGKTSSPDPLFSSAHSIALALNRTLMCTCWGLRDLGHPKTQVPSTPAGTSQDLGKTMGEMGVRTPKPTPPALPSTLYALNRLFTRVSEAPESIARVVGGPSRPNDTPADRYRVTPGQMAVQPDHVSWSIACTGRPSCPQSSGSRSRQVPCTSCDAFSPPQCY